MKRILIALMASMMVITTAACGNSGSSSSEPVESSSTSSSDVASDDSSAPEESAPEESAPETTSSEAAGDVTANAAASIPVPADATDEEKAYIEELNKALPAIADIQASQAEAASDPEAAKKILEDMKPKFDALGGLKAPEKYAEVQAKFAEGSKAMNDYIDYMLSIADMTAEEATPEKQQEAVTKMTEYATAAMTAFTEAYTLLPSDASAAAAADATSSAPADAAESSSVAE